MSKNSIADKLQKIEAGIEGVKNNAEIQGKMSEYGYMPERMSEGEALLSEAKRQVALNREDYSEQYVASDSKQRLWKSSYANYMITLKVVRVAFKEQPGMLARFNATGKRKRSLTGWLSDADIFYANLLNYPEAIDRLARFNISAERLANEYQQVEALKKQHGKQLDATGVAQQSTVDRDKAIDEACDWYSDFRAIARIALYERPQLLEALGINKK